jgi:hypothetical protein
MKTKTIPLSSFIHDLSYTVAKLNDGKVIMRVDRPRIVSWWLVWPAKGDKDCRCLKLQQGKKGERIALIEHELLNNYTDRIVLLTAA